MGIRTRPGRYDCPCGETHEVRGIVAAEIDARPMTKMVIPNGAWMVPTIYIKEHGLTPLELEIRAQMYDWEQVEGAPAKKDRAKPPRRAAEESESQIATDVLADEERSASSAASDADIVNATGA